MFVQQQTALSPASQQAISRFQDHINTTSHLDNMKRDTLIRLYYNMEVAIKEHFGETRDALKWKGDLVACGNNARELERYASRFFKDELNFPPRATKTSLQHNECLKRKHNETDNGSDLTEGTAEETDGIMRKKIKTNSLHH